ncbi:MAG TPA: glycosyltransferase family 39 protein [Oligoflexia bacterium]|nr:glycosyltransferase family 39 protein [Oligoflexia bacterium]HMP26428.1 glycosyltransferase family 39 protein [Oligoflexia bacterium]
MRDFFLILTLVLVAIVLRLDPLVATNFSIDSDEAIVGLMAKHINETSKIPVFYYGQPYMGSFEALVAAILFKLFGISSVTLKTTPLIFSVLLIPLIYLLGIKAYSKRAGIFAAALIAVPPQMLVEWSAKARGGFSEIIFLGGLALFFFFRWLDSRKFIDLAISYAILGLGWWTNNQIIFFGLPIIYFTLFADFKGRLLANFFSGLKSFLLATPFFFIGSYPFWRYNLYNNFESFTFFGSISHSETILRHLAVLKVQALPIILGAFRQWSENEIFEGAFYLAYFALILLFLIIIVFRWRQICLTSFFHPPVSAKVELLGMVFVVALAIFAVSKFGWLSQSPRYLLPVYLPLYLLTGVALSIAAERSSRMLANLALLLVIFFNLSSSYLGGRYLSGEPFVAAGVRAELDHSELINWLKEKKISYLRTNYWLGYRIAFETREEVKFALFGAPYEARILNYQENAEGITRSALPILAVSSQAGAIREALTALGWRFSEAWVNNYAIFYDLRRADGTELRQLLQISPELFTVKASHNFEKAAEAIDRALFTRWGSGANQAEGMWYKIIFLLHRNLSAIRYRLGSFSADYPRGMEIEAVFQNGERKIVFSAAEYEKARDLLRDDRELLIFKPLKDVKEIVLKLTAGEPVYDWSIAELELYGAK